RGACTGACKAPSAHRTTEPGDHTQTHTTSRPTNPSSRSRTLPGYWNDLLDHQCAPARPVRTRPINVVDSGAFKRSFHAGLENHIATKFLCQWAKPNGGLTKRLPYSSFRTFDV